MCCRLRCYIDCLRRVRPSKLLCDYVDAKEGHKPKLPKVSEEDCDSDEKQLVADKINSGELKEKENDFDPFGEASDHEDEEDGFKVDRSLLEVSSCCCMLFVFLRVGCIF